MKSRLHILFFILLMSFSVKLFAQNARIDSLKSEISKLSGVELIENYLLIAQECIYQDPVQTITFSKKALEISKEGGFLEQEAKSTLYLGNGLLFNGQFEEGINAINAGIDLCSEIDNPLLMCQGINAKAVYYMNIGDYEQTLENFNESLRIAVENNYESKAAMLLFNIGSVYTNQGEYIKGLVNFKNALEYFQNSDDKELIARIFNNIAVNYHSWNNLESALENYQYAAEIYDELNNSFGQSTALNNYKFLEIERMEDLENN